MIDSTIISIRSCNADSKGTAKEKMDAL